MMYQPQYGEGPNRGAESFPVFAKCSPRYATDDPQEEQIPLNEMYSASPSTPPLPPSDGPNRGAESFPVFAKCSPRYATDNPQEEQIPLNEMYSASPSTPPLSPSEDPNRGAESFPVFAKCSPSYATSHSSYQMPACNTSAGAIGEPESSYNMPPIQSYGENSNSSNTGQDFKQQPSGACFCPPLQTSPPPTLPPPSYESVVFKQDPPTVPLLQQSSIPLIPEDEEVVPEVSASIPCCRCLFTFVIHAGVCFSLFFLIKELLWPSESSTTKTASIVSTVVLYLISLIDACMSNACTDIHDYSKFNELQNHVDDMIAARPSIVWTANCYHYEIRYQIVGSDTDSPTMEKYEARIDTFKEERKYVFARCRDVSPDLPEFGDYEMMTIKFRKAYKFGSEEAAENYRYQKETFRQECFLKDSHMDFLETFEIGNLKEAMTVLRKPRSCFLDPCWFWLSSLLMMSWCFRFYMLGTKKTYSFPIIKQMID